VHAPARSLLRPYCAGAHVALHHPHYMMTTKATYGITMIVQREVVSHPAPSGPE
jgi:hypothetical protein